MGRRLLRACAAAIVAASLLLDAGAGATAFRVGPGSLDEGFGAAGLVTTDIGPSAFADAVALQPGGKIVAAGSAASGDRSVFALARYRSDGAADPAFGTGGTAATAFGSESAFANAVIAQPDGNVVAAGFAGRPGATAGRFALARYRADGSLDPAFAGGRVETTLGSGTAVANALAVQSDGKIVAGGVATSNRDHFALVRYLHDGRLDPAFGAGGVVTTSIDAGAAITALELQPDGKILAAGWSVTATKIRFALVRYRADGTVDRSFGRAGVVTTAIEDGNTADDVLVQPDGKIVVAGGSFLNGYDHFAFARYDSAGRLDPTFGHDGRVTTSVGSGNVASPVTIALQPSGKLIAAGSSEANWMVSFAIARYDKRGKLDRGFGSHGGIVTTAFDLDRAFARASALQTDGKIVVAGYADSGGNYRFALARYVVVGCVVPDVRRARFGTAIQAIARADCQVGKVTALYSRRVGRGRVISQRPGAGERLPQGSPVDLVTSRGRRR